MCGVCGRYILSDPATALSELFGLTPPVGFGPRFNVAPSQQVLAVRPRSGDPGAPAIDATTSSELDGEQLSVAPLHWGLIPRWAKDAKIAYRTINARSESAATKPAFRDAWRRRRCLIPADGFFEWAKLGSRPRLPYLIRVHEGEPFCFAGLWERWHPPEAEPVESCTILTTKPNELLESLHDRMPVILPRTEYARWLDTEHWTADDSDLLQPFPASEMDFFAVTKLVNNPRCDEPGCVEPWQGQSDPPTTALLPFD